MTEKTYTILSRYSRYLQTQPLSPEERNTRMQLARDLLTAWERKHLDQTFDLK
jgi:hypothetical protein